MDERFYRRRWPLALAALVLVGLCLAACAGTAFFSMIFRAAPALQGGPGAGPELLGRPAFFHPFGLLVRAGVLFLIVMVGLLVFLSVMRTLRWLAWGPPPAAGERGPWHGAWRGPWHGAWHGPWRCPGDPPPPPQAPEV